MYVLPKQHKNPITLHSKPHKRPPHQYKQYPRPKSRASPPFLAAGEEGEGPLGAEEEGYPDEEEDVAHGEQGAVEEEDKAEDEEEETCIVILVCSISLRPNWGRVIATAAAEGYADFCEKLLVRLYSI